MFIKLFQAVSAGLCALLMVFLFIWSIRVPAVVYSTSTVEYKNGVPDIQVWDVVEVMTPSGEKLPRSEWKNLLASGRFDPLPSEK
jgi:hypothetical protein